MKLFRVTVFASLIFCLFTRSTYAADKIEHGFLDRIHKDADGKEAKYVIFIPHDYTPGKPSPVILSLHGSGETGEDGQKQVTVGLGKYIRAHEQTFPFVTIFPQSQKRTWRVDSDDAQRALAITKEIVKEYKTDPKRIYLTGLSMGGFGTWSIAQKYPTDFAAIVPICGGGNVAEAAKLKDVPIWCFHGDADPTVKVELSRTMIAAIKEAGGHPKYTEFPGAKHNSWDQAYNTAELYTWLLEQHLK